MKIHRIKLSRWLVSLMLLLLSAHAYAYEVFEKLADSPQVESSYISTAILGKANLPRTMMNAVRVNTGLNLNLSDLKAMYTYNCYSKESGQLAESLLKQHVKKNNNLQLLMRKRQGEMEYLIYYSEARTSSGCGELIVYNKTSDNYVQLVVLEIDADSKAAIDND